MKKVLGDLFVGFMWWWVSFGVVLFAVLLFGQVPTFQPRELVFLIVLLGILFVFFSVGMFWFAGYAINQQDERDRAEEARRQKERLEYKRDRPS